MSTGENISKHKDDWQNTVLATVVSELLLVVVFLCPWRIESTGEIRWSPIYQEPMSYVRSYNDQLGTKGSSRIVSDKADIAYDILALEVLALIIAGGVLYIFSAGSGEEKRSDCNSSGGTLAAFNSSSPKAAVQATRDTGHS